MNNARIGLLFAILFASGLALLPLATDAQSPVPAASAAASATSSTVDTKNFAFAPKTLTVDAGATVVFKNSDSIAHTVTAVDKSFDSHNMDQGQSWSHVFAKAGTYKYICTYHTYMEGTIIVK